MNISLSRESRGHHREATSVWSCENAHRIGWERAEQKMISHAYAPLCGNPIPGARFGIDGRSYVNDVLDEMKTFSLASSCSDGGGWVVSSPSRVAMANSLSARLHEKNGILVETLSVELSTPQQVTPVDHADLGPLPHHRRQLQGVNDTSREEIK